MDWKGAMVRNGVLGETDIIEAAGAMVRLSRCRAGKGAISKGLCAEGMDS